MRSEQEIFKLIIDTAERDARIRAVVLEGSRANPAVERDRFQDYDIRYLVDDIAPFYDNRDWIDECLGRPVIVQCPDIMDTPSPISAGRFTYLMIFSDGNRIDLNITSTPFQYAGEPAVILLDKDNVLAPIPSLSDALWHVKQPTNKAFSDCCNEFWWCLNNAGKAILRDELPMAMTVLNSHVRSMLDQMMEWAIGIDFDFDFAISTGKMGRFFRQYLPPQQYQLYTAIYAKGDYTELWQAILNCCDLFHSLALKVANYFSFKYHQSDEDGMRWYLSYLKQQFDNIKRQ